MNQQLLFKTPREIAEENRIYEENYSKGLHYPNTITDKIWNKPMFDLKQITKNLKYSAKRGFMSAKQDSLNLQHQLLQGHKNGQLGMMGGNPFASFGSAAGGPGGWIELGRATSGGGSGVLNVAVANKRYYMILFFDAGIGGAPARLLTINSTGTSTYARTTSGDGGVDATAASQTSINSIMPNDTESQFSVMFVSNLSGEEKLLTTHGLGGNATGSGTAKNRRETSAKWVETTDPIDEFTMTSSSNFNSGDQMVVLGLDPTDIHTTNAFEELDVDVGDGASGTLTLNNIDKKYLWIQAYIEGSNSAAHTFRLGSSSTPDTGNNYTYRVNFNHGSDSTAENVSSLIGTGLNDGTTPVLWNFFIINIAGNEKSVICHQVNQGTAGAGTPPSYAEWILKWANTSNQADVFEIGRASGNWTTISITKAWGFN